MQKITKLALLISAGLLGTNLYANPQLNLFQANTSVKQTAETAR